ncbi:hypothetical protein [Cronobacter phage vB_Cdu_VP8]|nr:hypothetical protein [Cronobacter phage vB_Cdu_VP8]
MNDIKAILKSIIRCDLVGLMGVEVRETSKFVDIDLARDLRKNFNQILDKIDSSENLTEGDIQIIEKLLNCDSKYRSIHLAPIQNVVETLRNLFNEND